MQDDRRKSENEATPADVRDGLDTPVPVIDIDVVERNITALQRACDAAGVANRPHIKTHKSIEMARLQIKHGASGITCQKLGEAEVMAAAGIDDILISYNIIGNAKHARLADLNERIKLIVACDNEVVAAGLSQAVKATSKPLGVLVECDTGRHRCGVTTTLAAVELADTIHGLPGLTFAGLMIYPPNGPVDATVRFVDTVRKECQGRGLDIGVVSAGGTPNRTRIGDAGETEYRAGTYIYNDRQMVGFGAATNDDCALHVYATVTSHPEKGRIMIDAGSKTLTSDLSGFKDFGVLADYPDARIYQFAEEHGFVDVTKCQNIPAIGEIIRVLPNHVCPVSNLFDDVVLMRDGRRCGCLHIDARGKVN